MITNTSRTRKRISQSLLLHVACLLGGVGLCQFTLGAQEKARESAPAAHVRNWAVLGDLNAKSTYTLVYAPEKALPDQVKTVFTKLKGCRRSGYGAGYFNVSPGRVRFVLTEDGDNPKTVAELSEKFETDAAYTVLALLENGVPSLRLVKESPTAPELDGLYIYNFLTEPPLQLNIADGAGRSIPLFPGQAQFVPASQLTSAETAFSYQSKRGTQIRKTVNYTGGRLSVVFMRNDYSQATTFLYPARPTP